MRLLFDNHVHHAACGELQRRGVDVEHVGDVGLGDADDIEVLEYAIREERIVVTRNYGNFTRLVEVMNREGRSFPGVLFLAPSISNDDPGAHVKTILSWLERHGGRSPIENGAGWLEPVGREDS